MKLRRRQFIKSIGTASVALGASSGLPVRAAEGASTDGFMTVRGRASIRRLNIILPHEHVTTDFIGAEKFPRPRYDREFAFETIFPHLKRAKARAVDVLFECTPKYIGRDVKLLRRLSEAADIHIVTNTGYYGAVDNKFMPKHAYEESAKQLAARWLDEWENGIDGTDIKPGFIKLGVGNGKLPPLHEKLVRAAAIVHKESGLTICIHTGNGEAALDELRILEEERIAPEAFVWVHAQNDAGPVQIEVAKRGGWVSLDGYNLSARNPKRYVNMVKALIEAGCLNRVLLSHDDGWAVEGDAAESTGLNRFGNGNPEPYVSIIDRLWPDLEQSGAPRIEIKQLLLWNPIEAFSIRKRTF